MLSYRPKIRHHLAVCFISLAAAVLFLRSPVESPPTLIAGPLELADVWETSHHRHRLEIFNPGDTAVEINGFSASCSCVVTEPSSLIIPARERRTVELELDLTRADDFGRFAVWVKPKGTNSALHDLRWTINGVVRPHPLSVSPAVLSTVSNGAEEFDNHPSDSTLTATIQSTLPLRRLTVECPAAKVAASIDPFDAAARGKIWRLTVRPAAGLIEPISRSTVFIHAETVAGQYLPAIAVPVTVERVARVTVAPTWLSLGAVGLLEESVARVSIRSSSGQPFRIVETIADDEVVAIATKGTTTEHAVEVGVRSDKTGNQVQHLRIVIDADDWSGVDVVEVPIYWYGRTVTNGGLLNAVLDGVREP